MEAQLKGQVTHWRVMFISLNTEAVDARLQQSFLFRYGHTFLGV